MNKFYFTKMRHQVLKISFLMAVFVVLFSTSANAQLVHPGGWHTQDDLALIREKVSAGAEPWISGWNAIKNTDADETYTASVSALMTDKSALAYQGHAAYVLAIKWVASGEQKYASAAIDIIDAWVNTVEDFDVEGPSLTLSTAGGQLAQAAEIIAWGFNGEAGWSSESIAKARIWFKNVLYPWTSTGDSRSMNWGTSCVGGNMSMAVFCDDNAMFEDEAYAYKYGYTNTDDGCCGVMQYIVNDAGQCYESGRDQVHTQGGIAHLVEAAMCAWNQGLDLVTFSDNRIVAGMEYTAKYNLGNDVSWTSDITDYCNLGISWPDSVSIDGRGDWSPIYYMAAKLFALAEVPHPYTSAVLEAENYSPEFTNTSHPGMGTMCFIDSGNHSFIPYLTTEAENYIAMSGVDTIMTSDNRKGYKVSSIDANDWMQYEIVIPLAGMYSFDYRVSGLNNGDFTVELNGQITDALSFVATGGDENWETIRSTSSIYLGKGVDTLRIISNSEGWNLNWIQLIAECYESPITPRINIIDLQGEESGFLSQSEATLYPGFSVDLSPLPDLDGSWSWTGPNDFSSNQREVSLSAVQKNQSGDYIAVHTNDCGVESKDTFSINVQDSLYIEAEDYTLMNDVIVEATTDASGDSSVTAILSASWMEYEVNIPFSALYSFSYRVASDNAASFDLSINSEVIDQTDFNSTGGAQTWATVNSDNSVYLKAGVQKLRISSKSEGWNINWFQLNVLTPVRECLLPYTSDGFSVRQDSVEWSSGVIDISCETDVDIHMVLEGKGTFGESDYFRAYYKLDNGDMVLIAEEVDALSETMISAKALVGTTVELIIQSQAVKSTARFIVSNIMVIKGSDPFARIEAEDFDAANGTQTETCSDTGGGQDVGFIYNDNWLMFSNINTSEINGIDLRLATIRSGSTVEVRIDAYDGELLGTVVVPITGGWQSWETASGELTNILGFHDVYLVFKNASTNVANINWLEFTSTPIASVKELPNSNISLYPNPVSDKLYISGCNDATIDIYNISGKLLMTTQSESDKQVVDVSALDQGVYFIRIADTQNSIQSYKVIKQ